MASEQGGTDFSLFRQTWGQILGCKGVNPKSFVPVEVIPFQDIDIRISRTGLLLHKNTVF